MCNHLTVVLNELQELRRSFNDQMLVLEEKVLALRRQHDKKHTSTAPTLAAAMGIGQKNVAPPVSTKPQVLSRPYLVVSKNPVGMKVGEFAIKDFQRVGGDIVEFVTSDGTVKFSTALCPSYLKIIRGKKGADRKQINAQVFDVYWENYLKSIFAK